MLKKCVLFIDADYTRPKRNVLMRTGGQLPGLPRLKEMHGCWEARGGVVRTRVITRLACRD